MNIYVDTAFWMQLSTPNSCVIKSDWLQSQISIIQISSTLHATLIQWVHSRVHLFLPDNVLNYACNNINSTHTCERERNPREIFHVFITFWLQLIWHWIINMVGRGGDGIHPTPHFISSSNQIITKRNQSFDDDAKQGEYTHTHTHWDTATFRAAATDTQVLGKKYINNTNKYALSGHFFTFGFSRFDLFSIVNGFS